MTFPRARLTVAVCLFAAWLGYLLLLVIVTRHTIVLSRPQFLMSDLWVLADVADEGGKPASKVKVLDLFWFKSPALRELKDQTITIQYLADSTAQGYIGPGKYILPLRRFQMGDVSTYIVTRVPPSPGYVAAFMNVDLLAAGTDPERVVRLAVDILGLDAEEAQHRIEVVKGGGFTTLVRGAPREQALAFIHAADELGKKAPEVALTPDDVRIYPWTPETKEQIEELVAAR